MKGKLRKVVTLLLTLALALGMFAGAPLLAFADTTSVIARNPGLDPGDEAIQLGRD